jgi:GNAT superfamily N-acetyltransferase
LEDIFVLEEYRGRGIGTRLLVELAKIARDRDCGRMEWSVLDWNEPSIRFYLSLGAKPMDEWTVYRLTEPEIRKLAEG